MQMTTGEEAQMKAETATKVPLIIWSADPNASAALGHALGQDMLDVLPKPEDIDTGAQAPEMLLLCASPIHFLCQDMAQGTAPVAALERWVDFARAVLAVNRRNRRRVHVLDITRALADPGSVLARFGGKVSEAEPEIDTGPDNSSDPVLVLLAQRCLDGNAAARALAGELEAVMADSGQTSEADPDAAFQAWRAAGAASEEAGQLRAQLSRLQGVSENTLLLEQRLAQMSEGMASYQAQVDQHLAEKTHMRDKLGKKETALSAAGDMMRGLEAQANELNAALDRTKASLGAVEADRANILRHRNDLRDRMQKIKSSHSYRITAPFRALRALLSNKG